MEQACFFLTIKCFIFLPHTSLQTLLFSIFSYFKNLLFKFGSYQLDEPSLAHLLTVIEKKYFWRNQAIKK